jgi:hypothetical protein
MELGVMDNRSLSMMIALRHAACQIEASRSPKPDHPGAVHGATGEHATTLRV